MNNINLDVKIKRLTKDQVKKAIEILDKIAEDETWIKNYELLKDGQLEVTDNNETFAIEQFRELCLSLHLASLKPIKK